MYLLVSHIQQILFCKIQIVLCIPLHYTKSKFQAYTSHLNNCFFISRFKFIIVIDLLFFKAFCLNLILIILIPTCGYLIYSILTTLNKQPITDENTYLFVQIILIIFYFIFFGCIWRVFKYLLYSKK